MHVRGLSCAFDICFGPADCIHVILAEIWFDLEDIADELYHLFIRKFRTTTGLSPGRYRAIHTASEDSPDPKSVDLDNDTPDS